MFWKFPRWVRCFPVAICVGSVGFPENLARWYYAKMAPSFFLVASIERFPYHHRRSDHTKPTSAIYLLARNTKRYETDPNKYRARFTMFTVRRAATRLLVMSDVMPQTPDPVPRPGPQTQSRDPVPRPCPQTQSPPKSKICGFESNSIPQLSISLPRAGGSCGGGPHKSPKHWSWADVLINLRTVKLRRSGHGIFGPKVQNALFFAFQRDIAQKAITP